MRSATRSATTTTTWPGTPSPGIAKRSPGGWTSTFTQVRGSYEPPSLSGLSGERAARDYLHRRRDDDRVRGPGAAGRHDLLRRDRAAQRRREPRPGHPCAATGTDL